VVGWSGFHLGSGDAIDDLFDPDPRGVMGIRSGGQIDWEIVAESIGFWVERRMSLSVDAE
jgi:hypothetical protein